MKEKKDKSKHRSKDKHKSSKRHESSNSESDEWIEKESAPAAPKEREDWMAMTGLMRTYTKDDVKPKREEKDKKHLDSYNPGTSSRELNPYWKNGGTGVPQIAESFRKSRSFMKPSDDNDYYIKSSSSRSQEFSKPRDEDEFYNSRSEDHYDKKPYKQYNTSSNYSSSSYRNSFGGGWRRGSQIDDVNNKFRNDYKSRKESGERLRDNQDKNETRKESVERHRDNKDKNETRKEPGERHRDSQDSYKNERQTEINQKPEKSSSATKVADSKYLSDEKMNKLAAKIVKAEIMGDMKLVNELKTKLENAREYRKQNPNAGEEVEDEGIMLMSTNNMGNSRPLTKTSQGDAKSKSGKRKAETHLDGERQKYFGNDDKYNLSQMFEQEKYGTNYDNDEQLARIASKSKNPNDDLEDIFTDEITKIRNAAKDDLKERDRAIKQHKKIEKSLQGCEHCVDSKNMLKHLMVSCGRTVYLSLPARKSLVDSHCLITTIQHATCSTAVDEDVWEEIMDYRKALTNFFKSQDKDVVFFETATKLHKYPHLVIHCVPMPRDVGDMAAIYFKKALLECEAEWSMNKKVVDLKGKNIRKGIPKGLPYFWVDFGMSPGFAHVIEDDQLFPNNFAEEIIGGMLDLDHTLWKNPKREYSDQQRKKVVAFIADWKSFDTVAKK